MFVKINTKEHFSILSVTIPALHANMAGELRDMILQARALPPQHIILELEKVTEMDKPVIDVLPGIQQVCLAEKTSFVVGGLQQQLAEKLRPYKLNTAPTLAEAIDLVMMEQLEREL